MTAWHSADRNDVLTALDVRDQEGLTDSEVRVRRDRYGPNRLPSPPRPGVLARFLRQFHNLLIYVLLAAALLTALLAHYVDTIVILAVVLVNATIGFVQEGKAESALAAIRDMLAPRATVLRRGRRVDIGSDEVVPGDIVFLEAGSRIPADLRLLEVRSLRVEEAALTGESVPVEKQAAPVRVDAALGDRRSMAFAGTMARAGQARGVVVATAGETELGRISGMIADVAVVETPLLRQMAIFARWLTLVILGLGALILVVGLSLGAYPFAELFMMLVGLSVAAIPEGLPAILTVTLAIGVQAMARRNAIVRRLPAIEALGSVSVICSDKTGTLTRNEMTVTSVVTAERTFDVSGSGYAPHGGFALEGRDATVADYPELLEIGRAALLCNDSDLSLEDERWTISGDPMEAALVVLAAKAGLEARSERGQRPRHDAIPFDAAHRFMATLHHDHDGGGTIYIKGAPEVIIRRCAEEIRSGGAVPLDAAYWQEQARLIAASGRRVLAVAAKPRALRESELVFDEVNEGLTMLGLLGLMDPPRDEAVDSVRQCRAAGIRVKMITGDHADTAAAIGRQLGLQNTAEVLQGDQLDGLDAETLRLRAQQVDVFARTSPEHKLRLVEALQQAGEVVAMTGDGVNDAPALKRADIGVAMGGKGTEAAKEASEVVLADDNFATIVAAVEAGRTVYDNLKKAIVFLLPVNGGESLSLVAALLFGLTLPISPVQILWVNMVSSVLLAMTLAFEPAEKNIMQRPPRPRDEPIMAPFVLWRVGFVSVLFMAGIFGKFALAEAQGATVEEARTIAVNTLIAMEIFYLFAVRYMHGASITLRGVLGT
ncbi:MAG: HAD-IC family P-type ATPase, partial [Halieaceae bacterium]|nr:HAD-IC family P-type ATPase [Halieaceae bacterium]